MTLKRTMYRPRTGAGRRSTGAQTAPNRDTHMARRNNNAARSRPTHRDRARAARRDSHAPIRRSLVRIPHPTPHRRWTDVIFFTHRPSVAWPSTPWRRAPVSRMWKGLTRTAGHAPLMSDSSRARTRPSPDVCQGVEKPRKGGIGHARISQYHVRHHERQRRRVCRAGHEHSQ